MVGAGGESGEGRVSGGSAGTSLRGRFHTLSRPRVPTRLASLTLPLPGLPARPLLSLHLGPVFTLLSQPFRRRSPPPPPHPRPKLWVSSTVAAQQSENPEQAGWQERSSTKGVPAEVALDSVEAQEPALLPPAAFPTCLQLTSGPGLPPLYPP